MILEPMTVVVAFLDGSIYEFDNVLSVLIDQPDAPAPVMTLHLVDDKAIRINYATVKFHANRPDYATGVRQR